MRKAGRLFLQGLNALVPLILSSLIFTRALWTKGFRRVGGLFFRGFAALSPLALTLLTLYWLFGAAESFLGRGIRLLTGQEYYIPGMGVFAAFLITLAVGFSLRFLPFRKVFFWTAIVLDRIPLIKSVYGALRDLIGFFDAARRKQFNKVVMVNILDHELQIMGLVTREDFSDVPDGVGTDQDIAVYIPMSYQMGGFTVVVARGRVQTVDMGVDQAFQFALTAGVSAGTRKTPTEEAILGSAVATTAAEPDQAEPATVEKT